MLAAAVTACGIFDLGRPAAIDLLDGKAVTIEEGQTLQLRARVITAGGDSVPESAVSWVRVDIDSGATSFTIDSAGVVTALAPGTGSVVASIEDLRSSLVTVTVLPRPDLLLSVDSLRRTVALDDTAAAPLAVRVLDLTTVPGDSIGLADRAVAFSMAGAAAATGVALVQSDGTPGSDPATLETVTDGAGVASAVVLRGTTSLDSVVVDAVAQAADAGPVSGSPVRFVVYFAQN